MGIIAILTPAPEEASTLNSTEAVLVQTLRIERRFPKGKRHFLHQFADAISCLQMTLIEAVG